MPRQVVDVDVQMADPRKDAESGRTEHRDDVYVLCPVLDQNDAHGQCLGVRWIHDELSRGLFPHGNEGCSAAKVFSALSEGARG
jgi:hypothetical protein